VLVRHRPQLLLGLFGVAVSADSFFPSVCLHYLYTSLSPLICPYEHSMYSGRFLVMTPAARAVATDVEVSEEKMGEKRRGIISENNYYPFPFGTVRHIIFTSSLPSLLLRVSSLQARSFPSSAKADIPPIPPLHTLSPAVQHALLVRDLLLALSGVEVRTV
jgi:hypothetical protein